MLAWSLVLYAVARSLFFDFRFQRYDLGNMVQAVWSTTQGRPLETTLGTGEQAPRLAAHVDPILALLAPLWALAPTPLTLVTAQIAACALGALPVLWLARRHLASDRAAGFLALAYLLNPWLAWTALDAIHPATFAIPLFLFCIWFLDSNRLVAFSLCAILTAATGELMGVPLACLGLWYFVSRGHRRAGLAIAFAGLGWTLICLKVIIPAFWGDESQFYAYYASIGGSPEGVIGTALTDPAAIADALFTRGDLVYVLALTVPLAGAFLLSPLLAAAAIPQLAANSVSSIGGHIDPRAHAIAGVFPFLIAASVLGIARLSRLNAATAATVVLALSAGLSLVFGPHPGATGWPPGVWYYGTPSTQHINALRDAVELVPAGASVAATTKAGSHLSARQYFFSVPMVSSAEWVVIDTWDPWIPRRPPGTDRTTWGSFNPELVGELADRLGHKPDWRKVFERHGVFVFQKVQA